MPANLENSAVATGLEKVSFHSNPKERQWQRISNYCTIALISHNSKKCSKFSKPGFSNMWTVNFQMFKLVLKKAEEPEIKLPTSGGSWKKQEFQKNIYFCFIDYAKTFDCVDHNKLWKILKDDAVKVLHSICQQIWKTAVATGLEKVSFHSNPKEKQCQRMFKLPLNCIHLTC